LLTLPVFKIYQRVLVYIRSSDNVPQLVFCTPEYLFGTKGNGSYLPTIGKFESVKKIQDVLSVVVIDEAHKIFNGMPSFRSAFDELKQLKQLNCPLFTMSATLTSAQVDMLQTRYLRVGNCITIINSVNQDNLRLKLRRYKRQKVL